MDKLSLIIPCYNEEEVLPLLRAELDRVAALMDGCSFEFIFVDDGSADGTLALLRSFAEQDVRVKYLSFSRNFGKEAAIKAGLDSVTGNYVAVMDADMQDPPSMLPEMLATIKEKGVDSAATRRVSRKGEPPLRSLFARIFYRLMNSMSGLNVMSGSRDFRLMTRRMADAVRSLPESDRFSKGLYEWVGFKTEWLEYKNVERAAGTTKWSFKKLFRYAVGGLVSFTTAPLRFASRTGILSLAAALVWAVTDIVIACSGGAVGYQPVIIAVIFMGGLILTVLGLMGEYLARVYTASRGRPEYIVRESKTE